MSEKDIINNTIVGVCVGGRFKVIIRYNGKCYQAISANKHAYNRINAQGISDEKIVYSYSLSSAYTALWNECKRKNNLKCGTL